MTLTTLIKSIQTTMWKDVGLDGDAQRISQLCWMLFLKIIDDQDRDLAAMYGDEYQSPLPHNLQWRNWAANPEGITGDQLIAFVNQTLFPKLKTISVNDNQRRRIVRDVFIDAHNYMKSGQIMRQVINKIQDINFNKLAELRHFGEIYEKILNDLQSAGNAGEYYTPRALTAFMTARINPKPNEIVLDPACGTGGFLTCTINHMRKHYVKTPQDDAQMESNLRAIEKKSLPHMLCVTNMLLHGIKAPAFVRHDNALAKPLISYSKADRVDVVLANPPFGGTEETGIERNFPAEYKTRETADLFLALIMRLLKPGGRCAIVLPDGTLFGEGVKTRIKKRLLEECNLHTIVRLPNSVFRPYASVGTNLLFFTKGEKTRHIWYYEHAIPEGQKAYSMTRPILLSHFAPCEKWWSKRRENEQAWRVSIKDIIARGYNLDIKNPNTTMAKQEDAKELWRALQQSEKKVDTLRQQLHNLLADSLRT